MRIVKSIAVVIFAGILLSSLSFAATQDRLSGPVSSDQMVPLRGNMHGLARPEFDLGRVDGGRMMYGVTLAFRPSAAQQKDMDSLIAELGNPSSPNYHKYLTPKQFGKKFGLSQNDLDKITAWLQAQGFQNLAIANSRNEISFDGTVEQVEAAFRTEIHAYAVEGEVHIANATEPSVPAALAGSALAVGHLHDFRPKPRLRIEPHFTSAQTGNHFLTPGDFATIYDLQGLYTAGSDGTGQTIAVVGQTAIVTSDLDHFRSAAGLATKQPTQTLVPNSGTSTVFNGDLGETDLDLEWSGGVAKNATIMYIYVGNSATYNVWDSLNYAVQNNVAPFISTSYGFCEAGLGLSATQQIQGWAQQGQMQGQTIVAASGDSGAADCEPNGSTVATTGLAVDVPASIPEVTGMGGNEFFGDPASLTTTADWTGASGTDTISSAIQYISEEVWNDTLAAGILSASGGGASTFFSKPTWQTGTGVTGTQREVPDLSLSASPDHDGYLFCTSDKGAVTCTSGFRNSTGGLAVVGGTSAAAPTFAAILALLNQYFGNTPPTGLAPVNPVLYKLAANNPAAFHDVTAGDNKVPCTNPSPNCPTSGTLQFGYAAGPGYDQATGLGSVDGFVLAQAWAATLPGFSATATAASPASVAAGGSANSTITITPQNGFTGSVNLSCPSAPAGITCAFATNPVPGGSGTSILTIQTAPDMATGMSSVTVQGASGGIPKTATVSLNVTATTETFSLTSSLSGGTLPVTQGSQGTVNLTVTSTTGFVANGQTAAPVLYTCSDPASESTCLGPQGATTATSVSFTLTTTAPSAALHRPFERGSRIFYAALLPGLLGIVLTFGAKRSGRGVRLLGLVMVLGFSTMWLGSCGGSSGSGNHNPGTPKGPYTINITAKTTGANPVSAGPLTFTLSVQ